MIDGFDKQTQALPLDEQAAKRKRGRPATGTAMTPAEKQRAYRERTKRSNVTVNEKYDTWLVDQAKMIQELESKLAAAIARAEEAEKENKGDVAIKRHRDDKPLERIYEFHNELFKRIRDGMDRTEAVWRFVGATESVLEERGIKARE